MSLGVLTLHLHLPGCASLKDKRRRLKPLIARLHREFNISVAEMDYQDVWQDAVITCVYISNNHQHTQRALTNISNWIETHWPDVSLVSDRVEFL